MSVDVRNAGLAAGLARSERKVWRDVVPRAGQGMPRVAAAIFDATGGKGTTSFPLYVDIPKYAVILRAWWVVTTPFTSGTSTAKIAITSLAAGDIKSATVISSAATAGAHVSGLTPFLATSECTLTVTVSVEPLTAGVLELFVEYVQA